MKKAFESPQTPTIRTFSRRPKISRPLRKQLANPIQNGDRFIPNRSSKDFDWARYLVNKSNVIGSTPSMEEYNKEQAANLVMDLSEMSRILRFGRKSSAQRLQSIYHEYPPVYYRARNGSSQIRYIPPEQMQGIRREFDQLSRTTRGQKTLGQHLDRLSDVIGNAEEVKNLMKKVPPLEVKNRAMEQIMKDMQKKLDVVGNRVESAENAVKKLADQCCSILKTVAENIKNLLDKLDQGRTQGSTDMKEDQGPSRRTRANSKKTRAMDGKEIDELRASAVNMNILADQAVDLLKTLWLS